MTALRKKIAIETNYASKFKTVPTTGLLGEVALRRGLLRRPLDRRRALEPLGDVLLGLLLGLLRLELRSGVGEAPERRPGDDTGLSRT